MFALLALAACCAIIPAGIALAAFLGRGKKDKGTIVRPAHNDAHPEPPSCRIPPVTKKR